MKHFLLACVVLLCACSKVPAGNVGIKVYLLGTSKGVDVQELGPGRYWIGVNEELYIFPTFTQTHTWDAAPPIDNSISFQTTEGLSVNADIGISYNIVADKVPLVFQKYRKGIDEITDTYLRNMVRDQLVRSAGSLPIETVYGKGKTALMQDVETVVRKEVEPLGINIEHLYWVGEIRLPTIVSNSIAAKIQATQIALQRENEVKTAEAQAAIEVAKANGDAQSTLLRAKADAEAIRIKADALSSNARLVEWNAVEKWDGKLPVNMYSGAPVPFISVPSH